MSDTIHARERAAAHERCPFCREEFSAAAPPMAGDERVTCAGCGTPHHAECFAENRGCSSLGCDRRGARDAQGVERSPLITIARPVRENISTGIIVVGLLLFVPVLLDWHVTRVLGDLFPVTAGFLVVLGSMARGFLRAAPPEPVDDARPVRFAPTRAPVHGVEVLQQVLERPIAAAPPSPEDRAEPTGATRPCPGCSQQVEGAETLPFCYHCGATLT